MARSTLIGGELQQVISSPGLRHRLHVETGRIVVVSGPNAEGTIMRELSRASFDVDSVVVSRAMLDELLMLVPSVVVVDHSTPAFDVIRICRDLRETLSARIVVIVSPDVASDEALEVAALDAGADDFLASSTSTALLFARIRVALRRRVEVGGQRARLIVGDLMVDLDAHAVVIAGEPAKCPPLQFLLLVALAKEANRVVDHDSLLAAVWGTDPHSVNPRRLRIAISLLRRILGHGPSRPRIETVSHIGYRLVIDQREDNST